MDGCIYGSIARNLSEDNGSFWQLSFSKTLLQPFHEHPPLAFALQSIIFKIIGDQFFVERLYQLLITILSALVIMGIYRQHNNTSKLQWLAALLWLTTERVFWCANENMLESTMSLFDLLSIYFLGRYFASTKNKFLALYLFLAATSLLCAFLSKGLPALFPLAYFAFAFVSKQTPFMQAFKKSLYFLAAFAFVSALLLTFSDQAFKSIAAYLNQQVIGSVQGKDRVGLRLPFISGFFQQIIPYLIIAAVAVFLQLKSGSQLKIKSSVVFFVLLGLSAFLPLLVSPKLSFYYLVPSFPYFAIATALFVEPIFVEKTSASTQTFLSKVALSISALVIASVLYLSFSLYGSASRDAEMIKEVKALKAWCPANTVVSVSENLQEDWTLFAYMQRIAKLSVKKGEADQMYLIAEQTELSAPGYSLLSKKEGHRFALYSQTTAHKKRAN